MVTIARWTTKNEKGKIVTTFIVEQSNNDQPNDELIIYFKIETQNETTEYSISLPLEPETIYAFPDDAKGIVIYDNYTNYTNSAIEISKSKDYDLGFIVFDIGQIRKILNVVINELKAKE